MADYNELKGLNSIAEIDLNETVLSNLVMFFDWGLVDKGAFNNVTLNKNDIRGNSRATLKVANEHYYPSGQVWETFKSNLAWESGTSISEPIQISGVYVNNTLYAKNHATYGHYIDYQNGRVIFNSGIPITSSVKMEYSYKQFSVCESRESPLLKQIQFGWNKLTNFNQISSGNYSVHGEQRVQLPLVGFEFVRESKSPYEIGSSAFINKHDILCRVVAQDEATVKKIIGIISNQEEKTIFLLDMNLMAKSGLFPITYNGELRSGAVTYPDLTKESAGLRYGQLAIVDTVGQNGTYLSPDLYYGTVTLKTEVIA